MKETFNPMCELFPKVAACNYWRWGKGGHEELKNAICILGNNIINEKVEHIPITIIYLMIKSCLIR